MASDKGETKKLEKRQFLSLDSSATLEKPIEVPVTGTLPKWLKGSLYRNGSGVYEIGNTSWKHLFDGFAVLHRWTIQDGRVTYLSTILDSDHYKKCVKHDRLVGAGFGSSFPDPCKSIFSRFFSYFLPKPPETSDNTGVNIVKYGDRLFALTETRLINEVSPKTMLRKDKVDISKVVAVHVGTAHPQFEKDGTMYYYGTCMNYKTAYNFIRIPPPTSGLASPFLGAEIIGSVASRWKMNISYTHSFGMTENYFVHFEQPLCINLPRIMTMAWRGSNVAGCMVSYAGEPIDIHIVSKKTGERLPINFKAPHGFVFHFINCYEDSGHVVCDVCLYKSSSLIQELYLSSFEDAEQKSLSQSYFARFVLPLSIHGARAGENLVTLPGTKATAVLRKGTADTLDVTADDMFGSSHCVELPRINDDYNGQKYSYLYGSTVFIPSPRQVLKFDVQEKTVHQWSCGDHHYPAEPVFVPAPGATKEDDGVILCPILANTLENSSFLLVLDAATFKEIGRATTPAEVKMNLTFHGTFTDMLF